MPSLAAAAPTAHMPQLDGLRAWACVAVMISHFFPASEFPVTGWFALGSSGVRLFFVLSGFLITGILLREREAMRTGATGLGASLKSFYMRRSLRIFPLYYAVVFVLFILDYGVMRESIGWHLTYTMNFWRVYTDTHFLNHFWSLAVEEHFYLIWPFLIFWVPRAWLGPVMLLTIAFSQCYRMAAWGAGAGHAHLNIITFANLDTLALGSFLALSTHDGDRARISRDSLERWGLLVGGILTAMVLGLFAMKRIDEVERALFLGLVEGLLFMGTVSMGARGAIPAGRWILLPFTYLGKISYGLYVIHPILWEGLHHLEETGSLPLPDAWYIRLAIYSAAAVGAAALSWHFFELPLNRLKRRFPYTRSK